MSFRSWIELESDPGLFTLLVYDFGVKGVEVEEIYDLSTQMEKHVFGLIFLFKWTEERKTRRKAVVLEETFADEKVENEMFFAQQIIPNSCASHALLSVLLNVPDVSLGYTLKQLRDSCKGFDSESKGYAIGNFWNLSVAHNNHGRAEQRWSTDRTKNLTAVRSMEAFHYVSYIPYKGRLLELDGLKAHPIDHGPWLNNENWTDKARRVIQDRIAFATGGELSHDIRYNLMAVVPEQRHLFKDKIDILRHNKKVLIEVFKNLADKESFVISPLVNDASLKESDPLHPFPKKSKSGKRNKKSVSFSDESPLSPDNFSNVSTITGTESVTHPLSDSDGDSDIESYRIKSILRGKSPWVYVKGEESPKKDSSKDLKIEEEDAPKTETEIENEPSKSDMEIGILENVESTESKEKEDSISTLQIKTEKVDEESQSQQSGGVEQQEQSVERMTSLEQDPAQAKVAEIDVKSLLDQERKIEKLCLEDLLKHQDQITLPDLQKSLQSLDDQYKKLNTAYKEELEKIEKYKIDDCRRQHNYEPFVATFLGMLADQGHLTTLLEQQNNASLKRSNAAGVGGKKTKNKKKKMKKK